jgi:hypothetical protein
VREFRSHGSVRGAFSNERSYREHDLSEANYGLTSGFSDPFCQSVWEDHLGENAGS